MRRLGVVLLSALLAAAVLAACGGGSSKSAGDAASTTTAAKTAKSKTVGDDPGNQSAGDPAQAAYTPTGTLVADNGFKPADNGFPFQNYGAQLMDGSGPASGLTAAEMKKLYGTAVCTNDNCDLTPEAQAYMDKTNHDMDGGHCYGFSVAAGLLWTGKANPSDFGADSTAGLKIDGNNALMGEIAYAWTFQTLPAVQQTFITGDPNTILNKLKELLVPNPPETYTIRIFKGTGGHAITPYAIEDNGGGLFHVLVWDNNFPGITRAMEFDTNANTWKYSAALNPNEPSEQYTGDATSPNIDVDPSSPGLATQQWPYGGSVGVQQASARSGASATLTAAEASDDNTDLIYLDASDADHGHLLITNPSGQKIGIENGKLVNTIPGARVQIDALSKSWTEAPEPDYYVPDGVQYTITLDGKDLKEADDTSVGVIAPGYELEVDNIQLQPGETDTIEAGVDAETLSYKPSMEQTPRFELGVSDNDDVDWTFTVNGDSIPANDTMTIDLPVNGDDLKVSSTGSGSPSQVALEVLRQDDKGEQHFSHDDITLNDGDSASLKFGAWKDGETIPLTVTSGGQAKTEDLTDEAA